MFTMPVFELPSFPKQPSLAFVSLAFSFQEMSNILRSQCSCCCRVMWVCPKPGLDRLGFLVQKSFPWHLMLTCSLYLCTVILHLFCLWVETNCKKLKNPNTFKNFWPHDIPSGVLTVISVNCSSQNHSPITCLPQSWNPLLISWSIFNISDYDIFRPCLVLVVNLCDATMNLISISAYFAYSSPSSFAPYGVIFSNSNAGYLERRKPGWWGKRLEKEGGIRSLVWAFISLV